jgi:S-formylglutathione hydrolase FrmB
VLSRPPSVREPWRLRLVSAALLIGVTTALIVGDRAGASHPRHMNTYGATVFDFSLKSKLLGRRLDEIAIVPPGNERRPLLVLLHGRHDPSRRSPSVQSGPESMVREPLLAALAQLGASAPIILLPDGGHHSWYHDRRAGPWASMILDEAIPDALRRFHPISGRIAIGGISMGGYGALHLAALRPHEFCAVGAHSPALYTSYRTSAPVAFDSSTDFARNNVSLATRDGRYNRLPVWIDVGTHDPFHDADAAFASLLRARGVDVTYQTWPGGHTASYWGAHMAAYLQFYATALAHCSS